MQGRHSSIVVSPVADEDVPAGQGKQKRALVCPVRLLYVPARHEGQYVAPVMLEYVPELHGVHMMAPGPENVPGGHARHVRIVFAPTALENEPATHREQDAGLVIADLCSEYVPGGQP